MRFSFLGFLGETAWVIAEQFVLVARNSLVPSVLRHIQSSSRWFESARPRIEPIRKNEVFDTVSISPKGYVFLAAAVFTILSSIIGFIYFLGVWTSLTFEWMRPVIPYLHAFIVCALLLWLIALAMDYVGVRRAALAKPIGDASASTPTDYATLIQTEKVERDRAIGDAIFAVNQNVNAHVGRINKILNDLTTKPPEPTLKQEIINLHDPLLHLNRNTR